MSLGRILSALKLKDIAMVSANERAARLRGELQDLMTKAPPLAKTLRGSLRRRYVRCGKAGCRCAKGRGHGPIIYLSVTLKGGKTKQITVAKEDYEIALELVRNYKRLSQLIEKVSAINRQLLSERLIEARERAEPD